MVCWDDYCVICGGAGDMNAKLWERILEWICAYVKEDLGMKATWEAAEKIRCLDERDRKYTEDITIIGPFDENLDPIFEADDDFDLDDPEAFETFPASDVKVIEGLGVGTWQHGDLVRKSDGKEFRCSADRYPFMHSQCLHLLNNCTLVDTPQLFWELVRACNGLQWGSQGVRGINYGEMDIREEFAMNGCLRTGQGDWEECVEILFLKEVIGEEDIHNFQMRVWRWIAPDKFPVEAAAKSQKAFIEQHQSESVALIGPTISLVRDATHIQPQSNRIYNLPLEILLMTVGHLDLASFINLHSISRTMLYTLSKYSNSTIHKILQRTEQWYLPQVQREERDWDALLETNNVRNDFPWLYYAKECRINSPSMRNRRRIWKMLQQFEDIAIAKGIVSL